jgi:hypothetical protein
MDTEKMIKAYCLKTKEKNVPMQDAVISKTAKGGYMAGGHDGKGNKMAAILSEAKALQAIADGVAHSSPFTGGLYHFFMHMRQKPLHLFHTLYMVYDQQEHPAGLFEPRFIGTGLEEGEYFFEQLRFEIGRIGAVDEITAQRIILQRHFFKTKIQPPASGSARW